MECECVAERVKRLESSEVLGLDEWKTIMGWTYIMKELVAIWCQMAFFMSGTAGYKTMCT